MSGKYHFYDERIQESRDKGFNYNLFVIRKKNEDVKIHNFGVCWQIWRLWLQLQLIQKISFSKFVQNWHFIIVLNFLYGFGCMIRIKIVTCLWAIIQSFRKYSRSLLSFLILILIKNIYLMQAGAWCPSFDGNKKRSSIWQQTLIKMPLGSLKCIYGRLFLVWKKAFFNNAVAFCFFKRRGFFLYYDNSLAWKLTLRWPMLHWILCMH